MPLKIAILASGSGTNAQAMIDKSAAGILDVDIRMILSNRPGAGVLERARKAGLPHPALDHTLFPDRESYDRKLIAVLRESGADPARIMMVGDSEHDFEVARALGVRCVLFSGGHQPREVLAATGAPVIDALAQLLPLLAQLAAE